MSAYERLLQRRPAADVPQAERCDMCSAEIPERHRHALDTGRGDVMCTCVACALLFEREAASEGHYRLIPRDRTRLSGIAPAALGVPVGLAFFVREDDGTVIAHYPSPAGATGWEVDADRWAATVASCPPVERMAPKVEALLINTARDANECWLVPIDDCFRLVALVRREWKGLSGGRTVWPAITEFFAGLDSSGDPGARKDESWVRSG